MKISDIKIEELEAAVRKLASEHPKAIYGYGTTGSNNLYTDGKSGPGVGCLIGQAAQLIGVPLAMLYRWNSREDSRIGSILRTKDAKWLGIVQWQQDSGARWEEAVRWADEVLGKGDCDEVK